MAISLDEWASSTDLPRMWAKTWEEPHMKIALELLTQRGLPRAIKVLLPGVSLTEQAASKHFISQGFFEVLAMIEILKREKQTPVAPTQPGEAGWGEAALDSLPPEDTLKAEPQN